MSSFTLRDFDWSQRITLSSDKISSLRRPLLVLKLDLVADNGKEKEVILELEEAELKAFVGELNAAQQVLSTLVTER